MLHTGNLKSWDPATSMTYPLIKVYSCMTQLNTYFPQTAARIERHAVAAMNEWFTSGGSDIRLVYKGALPASHRACTDFGPWLAEDPGPVPSGSVVITAVSELKDRSIGSSGITCYPTITEIWSRPRPSSLGGDMIYAARIILARGETCSTGSMTPYPWSTSPIDGTPVGGEYDYWTALLHEFGHALGFVDDNSLPSVMNTPLPVYPTLRRHLFREDIARLRGTYGPIRSSPLHTSSTGPDVFGRPNYQPEPLHVFSVGQSACFQSNGCMKKL